MSRQSTCNRLPAARRLAPPQGHVPNYIASALSKPRAGMTDSEAVRRMAEDMRNAATNDSGITEEELEARGFTRSQVKTLAPAARQLAQQLAGATA